MCVISRHDQLLWLISAGGPFLALPDSVRDQWQGVDVDSDLEGPYDTWGDYGRACKATAGEDAEHYATVIDVAGAQALVLGEGKGATTFLRERLLFVQYAPEGTDSAFLAELDARLAVLPWRTSGITWKVTGPVSLIDSACPGDAPDSHLVVGVPPGTYSIGFCDADSVFVRLDPLHTN